VRNDARRQQRTPADTDGRWFPDQAYCSAGSGRYDLASGRRGRGVPAACQNGAETGDMTSTKTTMKSALTSILGVEFRPGIDMVRRRSMVRFRYGGALISLASWWIAQHA
jgi:hypothetical protein